MSWHGGILYSNHFTMSEMKPIIYFYGAPVGNKRIQQSPELAKLGAQIGIAEAQNK